MIKLKNQIINADMIDILQVLKLELFKRGIERFSVFKRNNTNIQTNCPFHKEGQERKPSFGINVNTGQCHCFTCSWSGSISRMIGELYSRNEEYGELWLIKHFNSTEIETREKLIQLPAQRNNTSISVPQNDCDIDLYQYRYYQYRYYHPYFSERGIDENWILDKFDLGYDKNTKCITFPVWDEYGNCVFVARRSVKTKFYQYPENVKKPVYALNFVTDKKVYVVESFFNALTIWKYGKQAVALIGTGDEHQYEILKKSNIRHFVLAFDPDEAGRKATTRFRKALGKYKYITELQYTEEGKDINDLQKKFLDLKEIL